MTEYVVLLRGPGMDYPSVVATELESLADGISFAERHAIDHSVVPGSAFTVAMQTDPSDPDGIPWTKQIGKVVRSIEWRHPDQIDEETRKAPTNP